MSDDTLIYKTCRYCLNTDTINNMIIPCECKQYKYVHRSCLDNHRLQDNEKMLGCDTCKKEYILMDDPEDEKQLKERTNRYKWALFEDGFFITLLVISVIIILVVIVIYVDSKNSYKYFENYKGRIFGSCWPLFYIFAVLFCIFYFVGFLTLCLFLGMFIGPSFLDKDSKVAIIIISIFTGIWIVYNFAFTSISNHMTRRRDNIIRRFEVNRLYVKDLSYMQDMRDKITDTLDSYFSNSVNDINKLISDYVL